MSATSTWERYPWLDAPSRADLEEAILRCAVRVVAMARDLRAYIAYHGPQSVPGNVEVHALPEEAAVGRWGVPVGGIYLRDLDLDTRHLIAWTQGPDPDPEEQVVHMRSWRRRAHPTEEDAGEDDETIPPDLWAQMTRSGDLRDVHHLITLSRAFDGGPWRLENRILPPLSDRLPETVEHAYRWVLMPALRALE